jgi:hypothetical protein
MPDPDPPDLFAAASITLDADTVQSKRRAAGRKPMPASTANT